MVEEVEGRTWLGRFVKARGDTDGLQELAGKVLAQVGTLTAAMQVQSLRGIEEIRAAISGGKLFSSKDLAQRLAREAGAARLEDVSPDQLRALLAERGRVDAVVALLAPGEQVLAGLVQGVEDRVEQLGARMDEQYASLMTHLRIGEVLDREPLEVKKLPPELRKLWADEDTGFGHMAAEMAWGVFHLALLHGELEVLAEAAAWYTDTLAPPQWRDFVIGPLRELLAPGDRVAAQNLYQLAQGAKRRGKLEFAEVRLQDVLWYVHVNTAPSVGQAAPPRQSRGHTWRRLVSAVSIARRAEWGAAARGAEPGRGSGHTESVADGVAVPAVIAALRHHDFLADADARDATFMVGGATRGDGVGRECACSYSACVAVVFMDDICGIECHEMLLFWSAGGYPGVAGQPGHGLGRWENRWGHRWGSRRGERRGVREPTVPAPVSAR